MMKRLTLLLALFSLCLCEFISIYEFYFPGKCGGAPLRLEAVPIGLCVAYQDRVFSKIAEIYSNNTVWQTWYRGDTMCDTKRRDFVYKLGPIGGNCTTDDVYRKVRRVMREAKFTYPPSDEDLVTLWYGTKDCSGGLTSLEIVYGTAWKLKESPGTSCVQVRGVSYRNVRGDNSAVLYPPGAGPTHTKTETYVATRTATGY